MYIVKTETKGTMKDILFNNKSELNKFLEGVEATDSNGQKQKLDKSKETVKRIIRQ